jgi:HK97 family phage prohead protease
MGKDTSIKEIPFSFPLEILKQVEEAGDFHIVGYAATSDFDMQGDIITEEALKESSLDLLKNSTVLLNHDIKIPIEKVIKAEFDQHGLLIDVLISKTEPDIIQKIKEGVLNKFSIRGEVLEREKKYMKEFDRVVNVIKRMTLIEVSLVSVPANPEAKAIGWYISKALLQKEDEATQYPDTGGLSMSKEAKKSNDSDEKEVTGTQVAEEKPEQKQEQAPVQEKVEQVEKKKESEPPVESNKPVVSKTQLNAITTILDRLIELGGEGAPLATQAKAFFKWMAGELMAPPDLNPISPISSKAPSEEDINKRISEEVKRQVETVLKTVPAMRKGLVPPESEENNIQKTFEGLSPEKKLKVALALQQG